MRRAIETCKHNIIVKVNMTERIFSFIFWKVCCGAYACKTISDQGIWMFEFPEDDKRRKLWTTRVNRKDFISLKNSRLCAKDFTNEQFVVNPLFVAVQNKEISCKAWRWTDFFKLTDKGVSPEESRKRKVCRQSQAAAKWMLKEVMCFYFILFYVLWSTWIFLISQNKYKLVVSVYK